MGVSSIVPVEWKVVAHEIGHSKLSLFILDFGAMHDCISATCGNQCSASNAAQCSMTSACRPCGSSCSCEGQYSNLIVQ